MNCFLRDAKLGLRPSLGLGLTQFSELQETPSIQHPDVVEESLVRGNALDQRLRVVLLQVRRPDKNLGQKRSQIRAREL